MNDENELTQAGFDAIAEAMHRLYPAREGLFYGTIIPYALGGDDPWTAWRCGKANTGVPHWHYVTYGFTELYEKRERRPRDKRLWIRADLPPSNGERRSSLPSGPSACSRTGPVCLFQRQRLRLRPSYGRQRAPIALETDTRLTALGFRIDPELGEADTPNGHFVFLQAVGLTADEMAAMMCWNGEKFLTELESADPAVRH